MRSTTPSAPRAKSIATAGSLADRSIILLMTRSTYKIVVGGGKFAITGASARRCANRGDCRVLSTPETAGGGRTLEAVAANDGESGICAIAGRGAGAGMSAPRRKDVAALLRDAARGGAMPAAGTMP